MTREVDRLYADDAFTLSQIGRARPGPAPELPCGVAREATPAPAPMAPPVAAHTWMREGACRGVDPDLFFPERGEDSKYAKAVCAVCPVADDCLEYALTNRERFGIWGGASERQRRQIRAGRRRDAQRRPALEAIPLAAIEWATAAIDDGDIERAWPLTDEKLRGFLVRSWASSDDGPGPAPSIVDALAAADGHLHSLWEAYTAWQARRWQDEWPADLRPSAASCAVLARPRPLGPSAVTAIFVDVSPELDVLRAGAVVPAAAVVMHRSDTWRVAALPAA